MKVYIAGPMRGYPQYNFPAFKEARERLREKGYDVVCPAEEDEKEGFDPNCYLEVPPDKYEEFLKRDFKMIKRCDAIVLLPGWDKSEGARSEATYAIGKDIKLMFYADMCKEWAAQEKTACACCRHIRGVFCEHGAPDQCSVRIGLVKKIEENMKGAKA